MLSEVKAHVMRGWKYSSAELCPYFKRKSELSVESGCILRGHRVIVLRKGQATVLDLLHEAYPGIDRMKKRTAREYMWWPKIDKQVEDKVKSCNACQTNRKTPELDPLHPWEWPDKP